MDIFTEGDTFADAIEKVKQDTEVIDFSEGILTYVDVDFLEYRRKVDTKTVRRNDECTERKEKYIDLAW